MFGMTKTLIVVYKDEMLMNQLKKMVETNDDTNEQEVVGTRDGSINIVSWSEKVWLANKKAGNIKDKVLFLGDIKGTDKLIPVIDLKIDEHGIRFGWAGNQAVLYADTKELADREKYVQFIEQLANFPVPEMIKQAKNVKFNELTSEETEETAENETVEEVDETVETTDEPKKKTPAFLLKAKDVLAKGVDVAGKAGSIVAVKAEDLTRDRAAVKQQMLFYGVVKLYNDCLENFMNS